MTQLVPLYDNVIVEPLKEEKTTKSGIIIPDTVSEKKPMRGKIIAVGSGKKTDDGSVVTIDVEIGDVVIFTQYAPTEFKTAENQELYIISSNSLLAVEKK